MCITAFAWQAHPLYPFVLVLNRDEYLDRQPYLPTKAVGWWEGGDILGGIDEVRGGTWLASSRNGKVAFVTNVLEIHIIPRAKSRGELPVTFLKGTWSPREFGEMLDEKGDEYNGFNLIVADVCSKSMVYITNRPEGEGIQIEDVKPGLHVLSNAKLDSPWPKAELLARKFKKMLYRYGEDQILFKDIVKNLMRNTKKADESRLPHIWPLEWEYELSSIFVKIQTPRGYFGTRSTAVLTASEKGDISFYETYLEKEMWKEQTVNYHIEKRNHT